MSVKQQLKPLRLLSFHIITKAYLDPQDPQEREVSTGYQVPEGLLGPLGDKVKVEREVCLVRQICYIFIYVDIKEVGFIWR